MVIKVNFVICKNLGSKIFSDIFDRFRKTKELNVTVSEEPLEGFDIYHYHRPQLVKQLRSPAVVTIHHDLNDNDPTLALEFFLEKYRSAANVVCLNSTQQKILRENGITNSVILPHGYDERLFSRNPARAYSTDRKVTLGILSRRYGRRVKGEQYLYEMADILDPSRVAFLMVGEERSTDAAYLQRLGFECTCFEFIPYRLFPSVYASIDALLNLSLFEGGPASIPESLMSGKPVLTTPVGMAVDMVKHMENGLILDQPTVAEKLEYLRKFIFNEGDLYNKITNFPQEKRILTWSDVIHKHVELYVSILGR